ncbi:MAG: PASTA domain-containing protein [Candidatus Cloacimonadota bacterium]|nr:PASTA domain-containing protein [Candidatus Cloacimonadota bacterium]
MKFIKTFFFVIVSFIIIFLLGFVISSGFLKIYTKHRNEVKVPELVNSDYKNAKYELYKVGLYIDKIGERNSQEILKGSIITQDPPPQAVVKTGYTIEVIVSNGPELVRVPDLDNLTAAEAKIRLINNGLNIGKIDYSFSDAINHGKVIYSDPISGMNVPKYSKVNIIVSLGKINKQIDEKNKYDSLLEGLD